MSSVAMTKQTAGAGAARAVARKRARQARGKGGAGASRRPGWVTYAILAFVLLASAYPLYYSFLLGSSDAQTIAQNPVPSLVPAQHFLDNVRRVLTSDIQFWKALKNSVIVATLTSVSVVAFSTLAGFSFSKLRFRGRRPSWASCRCSS